MLATGQVKVREIQGLGKVILLWISVPRLGTTFYRSCTILSFNKMSLSMCKLKMSLLSIKSSIDILNLIIHISCPFSGEEENHHRHSLIRAERH